MTQRCRICGRQLTKTSGDIGPVCRDRYNKYHLKKGRGIRKIQGREIFSEEGIIPETNTDTPGQENREGKGNGGVH